MLKWALLSPWFGLLAFVLAGCGSPQPTESAEAPPEELQTQQEEELIPIYEVTEDDITDKAEWASRNVSVLGVKLGDRTRNVEGNLGELVNDPLTVNPGEGAEDYVTAYQEGGIALYTRKLTGRARGIEINSLFADQVKDAKLKRLLNSGSLDYMRELFGEEDGVEENELENSTEYNYESRGIRFILYRVRGRTIYALRFFDLDQPRSTD